LKEETEHPQIPLPLESEVGAQTSQELPIVVLGSADASSSQPQARILRGRLPLNLFILSATIAIIIAGLIAVLFSLTSPEWTSWSIGTVWFVLYIWVWFYGIAYKYRRGLLWWFSAFSIFCLSAVIAYFCFDKAKIQYTPGPDGLILRDPVFSLWISAIFTMLGSAIIFSHFVFFGRGYREKKK